MPPKVIIIPDTTLDAEYERGLERIRARNEKPTHLTGEIKTDDMNSIYIEKPKGEAKDGKKVY